ncbi:hypothetical protein DPEC_G00138090 [Dallia pectoralis]|uniref:Uncharacterized protein n=1 Tax=Dallia pectoralis TaxID=75939 RepID=A0ACC2GM47_DALPE|nr:hypothetical protein DPEC_G00138090 [Dallia pectoralis]
MFLEWEQSYPSGNVAILISSVDYVDFTFIIMEDKDVKPKLQAIFTNRGQSTCYHPNGLIWLNLTQLGGFLCSETGALRRRWSWLNIAPHVQAAHLQPLCLVLGPNISLRIQTQERISLNFTSRQSRVRFNVGSELTLAHPEWLEVPGPNRLQKHLRLKSLEIYSLLDRMQTCMVYLHSHPNIKPRYSLTAQMQRHRRQTDKGTSHMKTHVL